MQFSFSLDYNSAINEAVPIDFLIHDEPILFGGWSAEVRLRGKLLSPLDKWTMTCQHHENNCEYIEIDMPLSDDYRLQRFVILDRSSQLLILADTLLWDGNSECNFSNSKKNTDQADYLSYQSSLCFSSLFAAKPSDEHTELSFYHKKKNRSAPFRVFPLALSETKNSESGFSNSGFVRGSLGMEQNILNYKLQSSGRSLFAPLCFDLSAKRMRSRYTWRHLTVCENLEVVSDDIAVGFRLQLGDDQFLLYHSMTPSANRSVLGHNLFDDLCFARFHPETGVEALVEVRQEDEC
ncbi:MAG: hypothetical protein ACRCUY_04535 [Thermoguttaceae bacterium]